MIDSVLDHSQPWTAEEYLALGETLSRVDLIDGAIWSGPRGEPAHQAVVGALVSAIHPAAKAAHLHALHYINVSLGPETILGPDLVVASYPSTSSAASVSPAPSASPAAASTTSGSPDASSTLRASGTSGTLRTSGVSGSFADFGFEAAEVALVGEVVSANTVAVDRVLRMHLYAAAGIPWYLLVEPKLPGFGSVRLRLLRRKGSRYVEAAVAVHGQTLTARQPFPFALDTTSLLPGAQP
ncbi:Uma2 family endonuclease [Actinoplanes utahensis]|uniref:Uma2 family endonuclease n=1 Tax=Actinoplanes utahensis TaxID=1869 RepID=UPI0005BB23F8|nr:Uma2 family endonuclease [Actinoplanes utahensis]GIF32015.1 hypothetical protein Aut01nite_50010 [Actinoplanes utahensis]